MSVRRWGIIGSVILIVVVIAMGEVSVTDKPVASLPLAVTPVSIALTESQMALPEALPSSDGVLAEVLATGEELIDSEDGAVGIPGDDVTPLSRIASPTRVTAGSERLVVDNVSTNTYRVTRVIDGDTIEVASETGVQRVRYIGVDTPETVHPRRGVECFGQEASNKNKQLVEGKWVRLEKDISTTDRYGRLLRYVYVDDEFVNLALIKGGYASVVTYPPDVKYTEVFRTAERAAQREGRGLWGNGCNDWVAPPTSPTGIPPTTQVPPSPACNIKGNINSEDEKIYHFPGCKSYDQTVITEATGEQWFCSVAEAVRAGWRVAGNCPQ